MDTLKTRAAVLEIRKAAGPDVSETRIADMKDQKQLQIMEQGTDSWTTIFFLAPESFDDLLMNLDIRFSGEEEGQKFYSFRS